MINEMEGLRMRVEYLVWALLYHYSFMPQLPMCSAAPGLQPDAEPQPKEVNESHNPHTEKMIETFREEPIAGDAMHRFGQYGIRARSEGLGGIIEKLDQLNLSLCDKLYGTTGGITHQRTMRRPAACTPTIRSILNGWVRIFGRRIL